MPQPGSTTDDPNREEGEEAFDPATLEFYSERRETYAGSGPGGVSRHLNGFLKLLPPNAEILELGCGYGRDAEAMIAAGHRVDATDGTAEIARMAAARLGQDVRVMRFHELDAVERYDAVWAHASLLHVPLGALPGILERVHTALRPGGLHVASYKSGGIAGRDRFGRYFNYPSKAQLMDAYEAAGAWKFDKIVEYLGGGTEGGVIPWIALTARRQA